jgi:hypothetical protein
MSLAKITIYLQKNCVKDDVLIVTPDENTNGYYASFKQAQVGVVSKRYIANRELMPYLGMFFQSVVCDEARCDKIQIDCPSFPTVIVDPEDIYDYLDTLEDQVDSLQDVWPTETLF